MIRPSLGLAAALLLALGACSTPPTPPPPRFADIRFQDAPPIRVVASSIVFEDRANLTLSPPEVEQEMAVPPQRAMRNWVADRIQAADPTSPNHIRVVIQDARIVAVPLQPSVTGFQAAFTKQQTIRYDAQVAMTLELIDAKGITRRTASGRANLSQSIGQDATLDDRDRLLYQMAHDITATLGHTIEEQISGSFTPFLQ
jgi:hypothetical protein